MHIALFRFEIHDLLFQLVNLVMRLAQKMIEDFDCISALIQNIIYLIRIVSFFEQASLS